jgi:hypothetical protein
VKVLQMRFLSDRSKTSHSFEVLILFSHQSLLNFSCLGKDQTDFYDDIPVIIRELTQRFNDESMEVVEASNKAFAALSKHVPAEELAKHIEYMRNLINSMVSDARRRRGGVGDGEFFLPGFNIPKGESKVADSTQVTRYEELIL